jgi:type IV pilus assembly protein PilX
VGVTAMQSTTMEERMAGNTRDASLAFQAAEAAVREAENYLTQAVVGPFNGAGGLYQPAAAGAAPVWEDAGTNWQTWSGDIPGTNNEPVYIIEELPPYPDPQGSLEADAPIPEVQMYRITAIGYGANPNTTVMLQTTYRR